MKNKITLLIVIGCIVFCATDVIRGEGEYIDTTEDTTDETTTDGNGSTNNQGAIGVDSADADGDWEDADGNLHSAAGEILFADGTFQDKNGNMYDAEGNKMTKSDSLTAAAEATSGKPATVTAKLDLAGGDNSPTKNGIMYDAEGNIMPTSDSLTAAANVAKASQNSTLDLSGEPAGVGSITTNDQANPLTSAENLVAQSEQFLPEGKTWETATEWEKTQALGEFNKQYQSEQDREAIESELPNDKTLETASPEEIAEAAVGTMAKGAAANTTSANPALDAFFKLCQSILDWFDTAFGKITEIFNNFDSIFNGTKTTTNENFTAQLSADENFTAQLSAERNAVQDLSPARMNDIQISVDANSNDYNNINNAKRVLGLTTDNFTSDNLEDAYNDPSLQKAAVSQILDGTSITIATNIKNAHEVLYNVLYEGLYDEDQSNGAADGNAAEETTNDSSADYNEEIELFQNNPVVDNDYSSININNAKTILGIPKNSYMTIEIIKNAYNEAIQSFSVTENADGETLLNNPEIQKVIQSSVRVLVYQNVQTLYYKVTDPIALNNSFNSFMSQYFPDIPNLENFTPTPATVDSTTTATDENLNLQANYSDGTETGVV